MNLEEIEILRITKKHGEIDIKHSPDVSDYEILGILETYTRKLREDIINSYQEK